MSGNLAELVGIDVPTRLLIGGEWTGGRGGDTLAVIDPATEGVLAEPEDMMRPWWLDDPNLAHRYGDQSQQG